MMQGASERLRDDIVEPHIPLPILWGHARGQTTLSSDEFRHTRGCKDCRAAIALCRVNDSLGDVQEVLRGEI
jgi:hypothetical protein